jgi:hypothetical protein
MARRRNRSSPAARQKSSPARPASALENIFLTAWRPYAWIVALGFIIFAQVLTFQFVGFDDTRLIINKFSLINDPANLSKAFATDPDWANTGSYYRPVGTVSLMLDSLWGGQNPFAYHFSNLLLHLCAACLVFAALLHCGFDRSPALVCGLLFSVHPGLAHAVAYIAGRSDLLLTIFCIASFIALCRFYASRRWSWYGCHVLCFAAALFNKETAALFPLVLLWLLFGVRRERLLARQGLCCCAGWLAMGLLYFFARRHALHLPVEQHFNTLRENMTGFLGYLGKIFFPLQLSVFPVPEDMTIGFGIAAIILAAGLAVATGIADKRIFLLGLLWFLVTLAPTFMAAEPFAYFLEQRLYLPIVGFAIMLFSIKSICTFRLRGFSSALVPAIVIAVFAYRTAAYSAAFRDELTFWQNAAATSPSSFYAHFMLGKQLMLKGQLLEGKSQLEQSIRIKPDYVYSQNDLGVFYKEIGDLPNAEQAFLKALEIDPRYPEAHHNIAAVYFLQNMYAKAIYHYDLAVANGLRPDPAILDMLAPYRTHEDESR